MTNCKRCGRCCHYMFNGKLKKCKFLVLLGNGRSLCRVYKTRLGRFLDTDYTGKEYRCVNRTDVNTKYTGCPYNEL